MAEGLHHGVKQAVHADQIVLTAQKRGFYRAHRTTALNFIDYARVNRRGLDAAGGAARKTTGCRVKCEMEFSAAVFKGIAVNALFAVIKKRGDAAGSAAMPTPSHT